MKEKIIIEIPKDMCDNCNSCDKPISAQIECYLKEKRQVYETVKVPETFEELKELCKLCEQHKRFKFEETEGYDSIYLYDCANIINFSMYKYSGCIRMLCKGYCVAKDLKPKAVWQIIKNLIGEE